MREESIRLLKLIDFEKGGIDAVFLHLFKAITKRERNSYGSDNDNIIKTEAKRPKIVFFGKQFEDTAALLDECPDILQALITLLQLRRQ